ncbi:hypothetical protein HHI36_003933, partial [Cryptolaemus montrouzieri]
CCDRCYCRYSEYDVEIVRWSALGEFCGDFYLGDYTLFCPQGYEIFAICLLPVVLMLSIHEFAV